MNTTKSEFHEYGFWVLVLAMGLISKTKTHFFSGVNVYYSFEFDLTVHFEKNRNLTPSLEIKITICDKKHIFGLNILNSLYYSKMFVLEHIPLNRSFLCRSSKSNSYFNFHSSWLRSGARSH